MTQPSRPLTVACSAALLSLGAGCAPAPEAGPALPRLDVGDGPSAALSATCGLRTAASASVLTVANLCRADPTPSLRVTGSISEGYRETPTAADYAALGCVCAADSITFQNAPIADLSGLSGLEYTARLTLLRGSLASVDGLRPGVELGQVELQELHQLTDLGALGGALRVGQLSLQSMRGLQRLDGLALRELATLTLFDLPSLRDLSGLDALESVGTLRLDRLPRLDRLDGVPALRSIGTLRLTDLEQLDTLSGLEALESLDALYVVGGNLRSLEGLPAGLALSTLSIQGATRIEHLDPVALAPATTTVELWELRWLADIDSLSGADTITTLRLGHLPQLRDIDVLRDVSSIGTATLTVVPSMDPEDYAWVRGVAARGSTPVEVW